MKNEDKYTIAMLLLPAVLWWALIGRKRYSVKGMTKNV